MVYPVSCLDFTTCMYMIKVETEKEKQEEKKRNVLFGSLKSGITGSQKQHVWQEITAAVSRVGVDNRSPADG